ncbi:hypothetical protein [Streptomyces sp. NPDC002692]
MTTANTEPPQADRSWLTGSLAAHVDHLTAALRANAATGFPKDRTGMERAAKLLELHQSRLLAGDGSEGVKQLLDAMLNATTCTLADGTVSPGTLCLIADYLEARAVSAFRADSRVYTEFQTVVSRLRRNADGLIDAANAAHQTVPEDACSSVEIDGEEIRVRGAGTMSPESRAAFGEVVEAVKRRYLAEHPPTEPVDPERRERYAEALYATLETSPSRSPWASLGAIRRLVWYARADAAMAVSDAEQTKLRRDLELAVAHDRQPYPTAWAYGQACQALRRKTDALERVLTLAASLDETVRELAGPNIVHPVAAHLRSIADTASTPAQPQEAGNPGEDETRISGDGSGVLVHLPQITYLDTQVWSADIGLTPEALRDLRDAVTTHLANSDQQPDRLRCPGPHCNEDITDYHEDDHVFRGGDGRPYCSGECVVAAHRSAGKRVSAADLSAILADAASLAERLMNDRYGPDSSYAIGGQDVARELRRLAGEVQHTDTQEPRRCRLCDEPITGRGVTYFGAPGGPHFHVDREACRIAGGLPAKPAAAPQTEGST